MEIKGLKLEENKVFVVNDETKEWKKADGSAIKELEKILYGIENTVFAKKDIKENVIFENEFKIGIGSVKSHKDEDGDLVYTFQKESNNQVEINEDFEFWSQPGKSNNKEEKINLWADTISKDRERIDDIRGKMSNLVSNPDASQNNKSAGQSIKSLDRPTIQNRRAASSQVSNEIEDIKERKQNECKAMENNYKPPEYTFSKRKLRTKEFTVSKRALREMLLEFKNIKIQDYERSAKKVIRFVKKTSLDTLSRKDGGLQKAIMRYNKIHCIEDTLESKFYLQVSDKKKLMDEDFDNLLKMAICSDFEK